MGDNDKPEVLEEGASAKDRLWDMVRQEGAPIGEDLMRGLEYYYGQARYGYDEYPQVFETIIGIVDTVSDNPEDRESELDIVQPLLERIVGYQAVTYREDRRLVAEVLSITRSELPDLKRFVLVSLQSLRNQFRRHDMPGAERVAQVVDTLDRFEKITDQAFPIEGYTTAQTMMDLSSDPAADMELITEEGRPYKDHLKKYYAEGYQVLGDLEVLQESEWIDKDKHATPQQKRATHAKRTTWRTIAKLYPLPIREKRELIAEKLIALENSDPVVYQSLLSLVNELGQIDSGYDLFIRLLNACAPEHSGIDAKTPQDTALDRIILSIAKTSKRKEVRKIVIAFTDLVTEGLDLEPFVENFRSGDIDQIQQAIYAARLQAHAEKFPEKPLDEVRQAFLTPENSESEIIPQDALNRATLMYEEVLSKADKYSSMRDQRLISEAKTMRKRLSSPNFKVEFFALARELFKREFGVYPYNTQIITCFLMLDEGLTNGDENRGIYAQIKTGEGKSLIFALFSSYLTVCGRKVDVITSNEYLASRDASKFKEFFKYFKISSSSYKYGGFSSMNHKKSGEDIIYTTSPDMIFQYLDALRKQKDFFCDHRLDVALVDEADNLCLDLMQEACRVVEPTEKANLSKGVYAAFIEFADTHGIEEMQKDWRKTVMEFRNFRSGSWSHLVSELSNNFIVLYLYNAAASKLMIEGRDYVIQGQQVDKDHDYRSITCIDAENTGRLKANHRWENGLHEFIEIRNGIKPSQHFRVDAQMTHPRYLLKYKNLYCISGTFGDRIDRDEISRLYGLTGFDVPSHHDSVREDSPVYMALFEEAFQQRLTERIRELSEEGRPVLVMMESIRSAQALREVLGPDFQIQIIDDHKNLGLDGESHPENELVQAAGNSSVVTISTNVAGRGTDIVPDKKALEAGGLCSIIGFYPRNLRIESQNRGRSGRQGSPGSSEIIADLENDPFLNRINEQGKTALRKAVLKDGPCSELVNKLINFMRKGRNFIESKTRLSRFERDQKLHEVTDRYFTTLKNNKDFAYFIKISSHVKDTWGYQFTNLQNTIMATHLMAVPKEVDELCEEDHALLFEMYQDCLGDMENDDIALNYFHSVAHSVAEENARQSNIDHAAADRAVEDVMEWIEKGCKPLEPRNRGYEDL